MSEFTPLRDAVDALAGRTPPPAFDDLRHRASRRARGRVIMAAAGISAVIAGTSLAVAGLDDERRTAPVEQPTPIPKTMAAPNGWVAVDAWQGDGDIYLGRTGENARRLAIPGPDGAVDACPVWSPDGTRLLFGRVMTSASTQQDAELVVVPVGESGSAGTPTAIKLDGFDVRGGPQDFDNHPCGIWAPNGRWVALESNGEVWVVDMQTQEIRQLPDLRPSDLEWRPGTDELTIAGDMGTSRGAPTRSTPVTIYKASTDDLRHLGSVEAAHLTWSPDGTSLAYTGGERVPDTRELWLVDADGSDERLLVADIGPKMHGIGPVWSPAGDRIAYQRCEAGRECTGERHEVVLVSVADGTEKVVSPPTAGGHTWYPFTVTWSPDGTTLLYTAWNFDGEPMEGGGETLPGGVIAVNADTPNDAQVLIDSIDPVPSYHSHSWSATQLWGRQPR